MTSQFSLPSPAQPGGEEGFVVEPHLVKKSAQVLRALNHPLRQHMLKLLHLRAPLTVTELYRELHLEQSLASQHLAILRRAGFVHTERQGKFIFYRVNYHRLQAVHQLCRQMLA